jgi:hypothetical protein
MQLSMDVLSNARLGALQAHLLLHFAHKEISTLCHLTLAACCALHTTTFAGAASAHAPRVVAAVTGSSADSTVSMLLTSRPNLVALRLVLYRPLVATASVEDCCAHICTAMLFHSAAAAAMIGLVLISTITTIGIRAGPLRCCCSSTHSAPRATFCEPSASVG